VALTLTQLQAGHQFEPFKFTLDRERSLAYRAAAADDLALYDEAGAVPPLAVVAVAFGAILEAVSLPPGSLHGSESFQCRSLVPPGAELECRAQLAQRSQRSGWVASVIQTDILRDGQTVLTARATVLSPSEQP
jgi:acyl dehydratase